MMYLNLIFRALLRCSSKSHLKQLHHTLLSINKKLWEIEDDIRECEREKDFGILL